jgi:cytochrome c-type biogenesis protein CcmH/NrfG
MTTNTVVLIIVAILVALALAGIVAVFKYEFRAEWRYFGRVHILDELAEDARLARRQDEIANELTTKAQAAQLEDHCNSTD